MIKIQHINIYSVLLETPTEFGVLCNFYTKQDAVEYMRYYADKMTWGGNGDILSESDNYISMIDYNGTRKQLWITEQRLTTMEELSRDGRL